jgi:hypothetical protein
MVTSYLEMTAQLVDWPGEAKLWQDADWPGVKGGREVVVLIGPIGW